jgi:pimeloyl-ACP methyl ester carboxylesterase
MQDHPMPQTINRLRVDGVSLAWTHVGDNSPASLLFLHGLGDSSIMTFGQLAQDPAVEGRSAILVDLPGFGFSSAPEGWPATIDAHADAVTALLDKLGADRITIVAHSMGASLAIVIATREPGRVSGLILAEPLLVREHSELGKAIAKRREDDFVARGYGMLLLATRRQAKRGDKAAEGFLEPLQRADPAILHRSAVSLLADRSPSFLEGLACLKMPRVLLVGERTAVDLTIVPDGVPIVRIPEAGHSMMSENPGAFIRAVAAHLPARASR